MKRADVVDLALIKAERKPAGTRFVLESRDVDSEAGTGRFLWTWDIEDNDVDQWRPSRRMIGVQLRRVADRYDPHPRRRRPKVVARAKGRRG